jgi:hypothetical protein
MELAMGMHQINFPVLTVRETLQPARMDDVRDAAVAEVTRIIAEFEIPEDDMKPFLLLGNREGVHSITPSFPSDVSLSFQEQLSMFIEQIGPMVLTQKDATCAALALTVWTAPRGAEGGTRASERPDRQEAVTVMIGDAGGAEQTLMATVTRHRFRPPTLGEFRPLSDHVQPVVAEAFRRGFLGRG